MNTTQFPPPCPFVTPADQLARAERTAGAVRFSELAPQKVRWLWPDRIPLGRITLLVSDPGLGKSLLTLDIAARVSRGAPWPDETVKSEETRVKSQNSPSGSCLLTLDSRPPSSVLLLTAEDDFADTVRPRLEALGADCDRILGIATVPADNLQDVPRAFALKRDLARLRNLLEAMPDCRLVVIDPINAYLGSSSSDVQSLLLSLTTIARERDIAVLIVSQLRKKDGAAIYRAMGSLAFVAASRATWAICKDPADETKRLLLPVKNNLAPTACGLAFAIASRDGIPQIRWSPEPVTHSIELAITASRAAGRPDEDRQYAIKWLTERLTKSPCRASDIREEADVDGINYGTLRRAYREIGGVTIRRGTFPLAYWYWSLPGATAQNPGGEFCAVGNLPGFDVRQPFQADTYPPPPRKNS